MIELLKSMLYWFLLAALVADILAAGYYFGKFAAGEVQDEAFILPPQIETPAWSQQG